MGLVTDFPKWAITIGHIPQTSHLKSMMGSKFAERGLQSFRACMT